MLIQKGLNPLMLEILSKLHLCPLSVFSVGNLLMLSAVESSSLAQPGVPRLSFNSVLCSQVQRTSLCPPLIGEKYKIVILGPSDARLACYHLY